MDKLINSCPEHIEYLLDLFIDENHEMPIMDKIVDSKIVCHECQNKAMYMLSGSEVKAIWD